MTDKKRLTATEILEKLGDECREPMVKVHAEPHPNLPDCLLIQIIFNVDNAWLLKYSGNSEELADAYLERVFKIIKERFKQAIRWGADRVKPDFKPWKGPGEKK